MQEVETLIGRTGFTEEISGFPEAVIDDKGSPVTIEDGFVAMGIIILLIADCGMKRS